MSLSNCTDVNKARLDSSQIAQNTERFKSRGLESCRIPVAVDKLSAGVAVCLRAHTIRSSFLLKIYD